MIQSSSLSRPHLYDQSFTPAKKLMLTAIPAIHSNLNRTSLFPTSKYGKITGKLVHSNHFFKMQRKRFQLDQPSPMGGIEPDLNGFSESTIVIAPLVPFELDSNCSNTAVNQPKILFQYQVLPPLHSTAKFSKLIFCFHPINDEKKVWRFMQEAVNPTTNKIIDGQKILIGFGAGRRWRGPVGGRVRVELLARYRKSALFLPIQGSLSPIPDDQPKEYCLPSHSPITQLLISNL